MGAYSCHTSTYAYKHPSQPLCASPYLHTHTKQQNKQNNANRTLYEQLVNRGKVGQAGTIPKLSNWVTSTMYSPSRPLSCHLFLLGCAPHFISFVLFLLGWAPHFTSSVLFLLGCAPHFKSFVMLRTSFHIRVASLNRTPPTTYPLKNNQPTSLHEILSATLQHLHACPMRHGSTEWEHSFSKSKLSTTKHGRRMDGRPMRYTSLLSSLYTPAQRDMVALS